MGVDYNLARAFQMFGLGHLALKHYMAVIRNPLAEKSRRGGGLNESYTEAWQGIMSQALYNLKVLHMVGGIANSTYKKFLGHFLSEL